MWAQMVCPSRNSLPTQAPCTVWILHSPTHSVEQLISKQIGGGCHTRLAGARGVCV